MGPRSILIVDDDPALVRCLGRILRDLGTVRLATNGADALRLAEDAVPSLILLDAEMPGLTGFEVYERLRASRALAEVPVIFVTSHGEAAFEVAGLGVDFVSKPVEPEHLRARAKARLKAEGFAASA